MQVLVALAQARGRVITRDELIERCWGGRIVGENAIDRVISRIRQVAASRSVNLVLPRPLVIFNDPPFDLTEEVAQQFNKVLKSVKMAPESAGTEPPAAARQAPAAENAAAPQRR